jgi:hypothetical protein
MDDGTKYAVIGFFAIFVARIVLHLVNPAALNAPPPRPQIASYAVVGKGGEPHTISGRAWSARDSERLVGVNIVVIGTEVGAATGSDGTYLVRNVPTGTYKLVASYIGYKNCQVPVTIDDSTGLVVDLYLGEAIIWYDRLDP